MLKLKRRPGESLTLKTADGEIHIYFDLDGKQIKIAIDAPSSIEIFRSELIRIEEK